MKSPALTTSSFLILPPLISSAFQCFGISLEFRILQVCTATSQEIGLKKESKQMPWKMSRFSVFFLPSLTLS